MKINKDFLNTIKQLIQEVLREQSPLVESPVRTRQEIIVEQKINKLLK
tara:strand:- start:411 stop:554 length:144 start_codon:yes stop_codon:yes gene_type:complete